MEETGRKGVPDFSDLPKDMRRHFIALYKMEVITEALNEGYRKADWDNSMRTSIIPISLCSSFRFPRVSHYALASAHAGKVSLPLL